MGKVAENKLHKKNTLLSTAFELFTTKGFAKTSISDIVDQAGVAKGTFYLYFKDKYDLQEKLIAYKAEKLFRHAVEHSDFQSKERFADQIIAFIDDVLTQMAKDPLLVRFIDKNLSWGIFHKTIERPDVQEKINYVEILNEAMAREPGTFVEPDIMLYTIITLVGSTCHGVILEHNPVDLDTYKPFLYDSIRGIIKVHQRPQPD
jgi:AcrR family transcriptional regulator